MKLWAADFPDAPTRDEFFAEHFDADGNASCAMWEDLGLDWFDHDFQEVIVDHTHEYIAQVVAGHVPDAVRAAAENTFLLLYDQEDPIAAPQSGKVLRYLGELVTRGERARTADRSGS
jgi:hypothetical protein